ncbi:outer membrane beta-barrel protein [Flavilitoribacter nigricans]|uniref:Outer membrane protein beta-barrel domain-containing protein n=1 Tax=Flavilitoribacter nigricans (strain ATCC 23147 / DSM 23189 / NBRC 102662 / NCIMB 1420 / SS-2) TaxID=1122177 RepID=A0A2D0N6J3_FLAN2|nr:outer membrane beta-barrel protein [Flavilitoribacter nigricans]PHN04114.1 hypothetical protein CRP01_23235 [Flavilitoribacter nigricans DSM 23189 = NBRC 102662]
MKHRQFICFLLLFCIGSVDLMAQGKGYKRQSRFKAGLQIGLNMAQIDGDRYSGYRRAGIQGGLMGVVVLNRNNLLTTELLFSQRGSQPSNRERRENIEYQLRIRLNYVEVPVVYRHLFNEGEDGSFSHDYHFGLSFGRLVSSRIEESSFNPYYQPRTKDSLIKTGDDIQENDVSLLFGGTLLFNRYFGLSLRSVISLTSFYDPEGTSALRTYHLTLAGVYYLN